MPISRLCFLSTGQLRQNQDRRLVVGDVSAAVALSADPAR